MILLPFLPFFPFSSCSLSSLLSYILTQPTQIFLLSSVSEFECEKGKYCAAYLFSQHLKKNLFCGTGNWGNTGWEKLTGLFFPFLVLLRSCPPVVFFFQSFPSSNSRTLVPTAPFHIASVVDHYPLCSPLLYPVLFCVWTCQNTIPETSGDCANLKHMLCSHLQWLHLVFRSHVLICKCMCVTTDLVTH